MARQQRTKTYRVAQWIVTTAMGAWGKPDWRGLENLPRDTGFIAAVNHISYIDPLAVAEMLVKQQAYPYFMAKESLFRWPVTGYLMTHAEQIPVARRTTQAQDAYEQAVSALAEDKVVVMFPEGTITRNADLWPMRGKTGVARLALRTGKPVVPIATWGGQQALPAYGRGKRRLLPAPTVSLQIGKPMYFEEAVAAAPSVPLLHEVTARIMAAIEDELQTLRGESRPAS